MKPSIACWEALDDAELVQESQLSGLLESPAVLRQLRLVVPAIAS